MSMGKSNGWKMERRRKFRSENYMKYEVLSLEKHTPIILQLDSRGTRPVMASPVHLIAFYTIVKKTSLCIPV